MTFKPTIWYPIAIALTAINLAGVAFAARASEPWHATTHAALAVAFGLWALRLRQGRGGTESQPQARLDAFEAELGNLQRELSEMQERLDFAERMLTQATEARRMEPPR